MNARLRPRRIAHRGHVLVHGVSFSPRRGELTMRHSALKCYEAGARFYLHEGGISVIWAAPQRLSVPLPSGTPLVRYDQLLSALPLSAQELGEVTQHGPVVIDALGGRTVERPLNDDTEIDPSRWVDLQGFRSARAISLSAPVRPPKVVKASARSGREALDDVVEEAPSEVREIVQALSGRGSQQGGRAMAPRAGFGSALSRWFERLRAWFSPPSRGSHQRETTALALPSRGSVWGRWFARLRNMLGSLAWRSHLGRWLGKQHRDYFMKMLDMFERGDYREALRHAIPTSKDGSADTTLALLPPAARESIELGGARGAGSTLGVGGDLFAHLREVYKRAFRELERQGRILEAAFVLSELLEEDAEAVDFLERHGKLEQAAKLAEARQLGAGLVVRQWFVAGNRQRAVAIARRDGAFEDAIQRLSSKPELQTALRLLWADQLATSGDYASAVNVMTQIRQGRAISEVWLERAVAVGGIAGARALALWANLHPESFERVREAAETLIVDESTELAPARLELGRALSRRGDGTREGRALARGVARALIRDRARGNNLAQRGFLQRLSRFSDDGALQADVPVLPTVMELPQLQTERPARQLVVRSGDIGPSPIEDAALVGNGNLLVAKGEAGVWLYDRRGRTRHHFDVPAEALVLSLHGDRALALARRDELTIVSRVDITGRRCQRWTELSLEAHAASFDGSVWYVAMQGRVHALDATSDGRQSLWRSANTMAHVDAISWEPGALCFATSGEECWHVELDPHVLRRRQPCTGYPVLTARGVAAELRSIAGEHTELYALCDPENAFTAALGGSEAVRVHSAAASKKWLVAVVRVRIEVPPVFDVKLFERDSWQQVLNLRLEASHYAQVRLDDQQLVVSDDRGRALALELTLGGVFLDVRI